MRMEDPLGVHLRHGPGDRVYLALEHEFGVNRVSDRVFRLATTVDIMSI
jgi:hypothetical protein